MAQEYPLFECTFHDEITGESKQGHLPLFENWLQFFLDYFSALKSSGIAFVKVDNQAFIDALTEGGDAGQIKAHGHALMVKAAVEVFGRGKVIHCMSQSGRFNAGEFGLGVNADAVGAAVR